MHTFVELRSGSSFVRLCTVAATVLAALAFASPAAADGDPVLDRVDQALNRFERLQLRYDVTTTKSDGSSSTIDVEVWMKNSKKRGRVNQALTEVHNGDLAGTLLLQRSADSTHLYMPGFRRIRRIGSADLSASFLGTALAPATLYPTRYTVHYDATIESESEGSTTLLLRQRGSDAPFAKIRMTVDSDRRPVRLDHYDARDRLVMTEERQDYSACKANFCAARTRIVTDHTRNTTSRLGLKTYRVDGKLERNGSKVKFTKRELR